MIYRFACFELDTTTRELRVDGEVRAVQPQAFSVLVYLVEHRDRAVSKRELLEKLWPDATVGEGSLQRAVHLVRAAIDDDGTRLRTVPRHGYRFAAPVERSEDAPGASAPDVEGPLVPRFARSGDVHIAFHSFGEGELDIVLVPGWAFPMRAYFEHPALRRSIEELTAFGRVILFDKRGTGLSDRVVGLPPLEQRMDDLRAVLEAAGSREALLVGYSEGGPLCLLYAASYPERTRGLLLVSSFARWAAAPDYPCGWSPEVVERLRGYIGRAWGAGETIRAIVSSRASDPVTIAWAARAEQEGASPGAALELLEMNLQVDVRPLLHTICVPTAILHHTRDAVIDVENSRYLAAHIPGARYFEVDGGDHVFFFEDPERQREALAWLADQREAPTERFLTTILAVDASPDDIGDVDEVVARFRGTRAGPALTWSFDGPQRAIRCAHALAKRWAAPTASSARIGVHTGEVARQGASLVGDALAVAATIAGAADPGEVRVSRVVRDLVHGSPLRFAAQRDVELGGGRVLPTLASVPGGAPTRKKTVSQG